MKKFIFVLSLFLCFSFTNNATYCIGINNIIKQGMYTIYDLNLSPDIDYTVQNNSFNERAFVAIFDSKPSLIQFFRLTAQSRKYDLATLKDGYTILILGNGEVIFSKKILR
ncbi:MULTISPECIES: hypothetical protein [unclassified Clostridium]|uniref:hypothetical protein n=1 Tax=unclassified Clostridium TaxID=2614128 RepID=UPI0002982719|nr:MULTISPECIES: hypothetical protein [unclassified Clostridium]EKQ52805.1 MAG: hypothetical protein A370_04024 [Clostridium sp. Maddingley MBC34-26]